MPLHLCKKIVKFRNLSKDFPVTERKHIWCFFIFIHHYCFFLLLIRLYLVREYKCLYLKFYVVFVKWHINAGCLLSVNYFHLLMLIWFTLIYCASRTTERNNNCYYFSSEVFLFKLNCVLKVAMVFFDSIKKTSKYIMASSKQRTTIVANSATPIRKQLKHHVRFYQFLTGKHHNLKIVISQQPGPMLKSTHVVTIILQS